jgi:hypothetical protein
MNKILKLLFQEDIADRKAPNFQERFPEIEKRDKVRVKKVIEIIKDKKALELQDLYYSSFIFHHQGTKIATQKAQSLAKEGVKICGEKKTKICNRTRWLYAAATDRLLTLNKKPQKYGTQYHRLKNGKGFKLLPVDPKTTDKERMALNVPTLAEAKINAKNIK